MFYCKELNQEFDSLNKMHKALKANEGKLIGLKKAQLHKSAEKGQLSINGAYLKLSGSQKATFEMKEDYIYPVINTTRYMDSHNDVHFDGLWNKTQKEQQGKVYYKDSHLPGTDNVIAWKEDVRMFTAMIPWQWVGKDYDGETQALIFEIAKSALKKQTAIDAINDKRDVENSVSMYYVVIKLAVNSDEKEYKTNKTYFDKRYPEIANKEIPDELGYFWGIEEGKIAGEGSMVLAASNDATAILYNIKEPPEGTQQEPSKDTQRKAVFINLLKN